MKRLIPFLILLPTLFFSCKKKREAPAMTKENIAGVYKITSISSRDATDLPEYDSFADDDPCMKDNLYTFTVDNKLICTDAGLPCDPQAQWSLNWSLQDSAITIGFNHGEITKFTGSQLEITLNWSEAYDRITYTRQ